MFRKTPKATYFFTEAEHDILKVLCAYMVGVSNDAALDIPVITIDAFVQQLPKPLRRRIRFGIHLFQWGPPLFIGKLCFFTQLDPHESVRYIEGWARSRLRTRRQLFRGLRDIAFLGYYSDN
jgi:hypothetical protein